MRVKHSFKLIAAMGIAAACIPGLAHATAIDVGLANETLTNQTGNSTNQGIYPITSYSNSPTGDGTPNQVSIPDAPSVNYDAADTNDTGTLWNVIEGTGTAPSSNSSGSTVNVEFQAGIPLRDSTGASTGVTLDVSEILPNGKADYIHPNGSNAGAAGTDGLAPNPASTNDAITSGASHDLLMNESWITNSTSEGMLFTLHGLTPGTTYGLYVYGAGGSADGEGGAFSLAAGNVLAAGSGGISSASTNTSASAWYRSVFGGTNLNDPAPEMGLSWNELIGVADSNGNFTFQELQSGDNVKAAMNGFQIQAAVPEPAAVSVLALAAVGLRRRK